MFKIKKYLILYGIFIFFFSFICMLYYYGVINNMIFKVFKFIPLIILFIVQGMYSYKDLSKFGFIYCFIPSLILITFPLIISIISNKFRVNYLLYLLILLISSLFGIFIKRKKQNLSK